MKTSLVQYLELSLIFYFEIIINKKITKKISASFQRSISALKFFDRILMRKDHEKFKGFFV